MTPAEAKFDEKYIPEPNSGCWLWNGAVSGSGYGATTFRGNHAFSAHRASWIMTNGEIPKGKFVCHKCDVKTCVNPDHLFIGTPKENTQDMMAKGRRVAPGTENRMRGDDWHKAHDGKLPVGEKHPMAKLAEQDVIAIRKSPKTGVELAAQYSVSAKTISRVRRREHWRTVL